MKQILQNLANGETSLVDVPCPQYAAGSLFGRYPQHRGIGGVRLFAQGVGCFLFGAAVQDGVVLREALGNGVIEGGI